MSTAALRQRRHRERERDGKLVISIEVDTAEVVELLVEARLLDGRRDHFSREAIGDAIERFLALARRA